MYTFVVRHGETDFSQNDIVQGHFQNSLNGVGINTIRKVASIFVAQNVAIRSIYASDLKRCVESAQIIANAIGFRKEVTYDITLREMNLGIFEGKHRDELEKARVDSGHYSAYIPQGGESIDMLFSRIENWLNRYYDKLGNALIVSHRGPISAMYHLADNRNEWNENILLEHGKVIVFDFSSSQKKIVDILG